MARLRKKKNRRASRAFVALLLGGSAVFAGYVLWPSGPDEALADAASDESRAPAPKPAAALSAGKFNPVLTQTPGAAPDMAATDAEPAKADQPSDDAPEQLARDFGEALTRGADNGPVAALPSAAPVAPAPDAGFLDDAMALQNQGKLLEARALLNDALQTDTLDDATADEAKSRIRDLNQTIIFTPSRRYNDDPQQSAYTVQSGDLLAKICRNIDVPYQFIARVNAVKPDRIRVGQSLKLIQGPIHGVVSKSRFTLDLYLGGLPGEPGSMYLTTYKVGLGESGSTPTGTWEVTRNSKTVNPAWTNPRTNEVFGRDDPKNPLGERWIGLTGIAGEAVGAVSYGIHGTIEPETIGTNASMGCVRLADEAIVEVFDMLSEGKSLIRVVD